MNTPYFIVEIKRYPFAAFLYSVVNEHEKVSNQTDTLFLSYILTQLFK